MAHEPSSGREYAAQDAAVAQVGPAQSLSDQRAAPRSDVDPERRQRMLDEREERFTRARKPMGPTSDQVPETVPEDVTPPSDGQSSTTPEPNEP
ncbi:hypothetical protein [Streptomyces capillispiralis]|uniref:Uncharacterized protein n=1 Tax=Streptomyces capillispiralis TaxID=68182 RepID=A0A561T7P9_9ACTN|nr:hypothetical protein [Streptomyces capillispiralis]TWF83131.1 hypothetical protein FHX78_1144 [Streptomyces capillispiralis]GHH94633.1 hypothetical protein GCM10017779_50900 [Streptomyces capillispiralis]